MRTKKGFRPRLEALEERWVPATVVDKAGILQVSNQVGALTVTASSSVAGQVTVADSKGSVTYSNVGTLIEITGTNLADTITYAGGDGTGFSGNVLISGGNGNDVVTVTGSIGGYLDVLGGPSTGAGSSLSLNGPIGGNFTYNHTSGANKVTLDNSGVVIGGSASLTGLGTLTVNEACLVGGNLTLMSSPTGGLTVNGTQGDLTVGSPGSNGSLTVTGGTGVNSFTTGATGIGLLTVSGNASFNFNGTSNTLDLSGVTAGSTIGGNLYYTGGASGSTVNLDSTGANNLTINNNATITLSGNNTLTGLDGLFAVGGNFTLNLGNGNNGNFTIGGTVGGNESIYAGNGNNVITAANAPGGLLTFIGGNAPTGKQDKLTLGQNGLSQTFDVYLSFGTGTNVLADTSTAADPDTITGTVIGNGGNNTFNQHHAILVDVNFINFP